MLRLEKTDPKTGDVTAIEINPGGTIDIIVSDPRARERGRVAFAQFAAATDCKVLVHTADERTVARKKAQHDA